MIAACILGRAPFPNPCGDDFAVLNEQIESRNGTWIIRVGAMQRLAVVLAVGVAAYLAQPNSISWHTRAVVSWDLSVLIYLGLAWWLIASADAAMTRDHALSQDQSVYVIFLFVVVAAFASVVAIGFVVSTIRELDPGPGVASALTVGALISSWLLIQTVFAFHYAHRYYAILHRQRTATPELVFPGGKEPDYLDFAYYSFVVGMTSQVSDVAVTARQMRGLTLVHSVLAFVFNIAVLALSINIIASVI
jgi:uncharacterized membrane protein